MSAVSDRPLRADAARNAGRILRAARDVYGDLGPEAPIEAVARRAGVGERTLYRRFPTKGELVRAALDQCIAEGLTPTIEAVRDVTDPLEGLAQLIDAAISLGARERNLLTAARNAGSLTPEISTALYDALNDLARRGQQAGVVRADLVPADLPRIIAMLHSVLWTMDPDDDGWRRYVALMLDSISVGHRGSLPAATALRFAPVSDTWSMAGDSG
jgi:AcrR family transcriptional regulator